MLNYQRVVPNHLKKSHRIFPRLPRLSRLRGGQMDGSLSGLAEEAFMMSSEATWEVSCAEAGTSGWSFMDMKNKTISNAYRYIYDNIWVCILCVHISYIIYHISYIIYYIYNMYVSSIIHTAVNPIINNLQRLVGMMSNVWPTNCDCYTIILFTTYYMYI